MDAVADSKNMKIKRFIINLVDWETKSKVAHSGLKPDANALPEMESLEELDLIVRVHLFNIDFTIVHNHPIAQHRGIALRYRHQLAAGIHRILHAALAAQNPIIDGRRILRMVEHGKSGDRFAIKTAEHIHPGAGDHGFNFGLHRAGGAQKGQIFRQFNAR